MSNRIPEKMLTERKIKGVISINMLFCWIFVVMFCFSFLSPILGLLPTLGITGILFLIIFISYIEIHKISIYQYYLKLFKYQINKKNYKY